MELGIGIRVYVGWTPNTSRPDLVCRTGVIVDGPDWNYVTADGSRRAPGKSWGVAMDDGPIMQAVERILTPIDDLAETITTERREELPA